MTFPGVCGLSSDTSAASLSLSALPITRLTPGIAARASGSRVAACDCHSSVGVFPVDPANHLPDLPVRTLSYGAGIYYHQLRIERILRFPHGAAAQTLTNRRTIRLIATTAKGVDKELRHCGPF